MCTRGEQNDATMVEINPLAVNTNNEVLCMDAKFSFDDNGTAMPFPVGVLVHGAAHRPPCSCQPRSGKSPSTR